MKLIEKSKALFLIFIMVAGILMTGCGKKAIKNSNYDVGAVKDKIGSAKMTTERKLVDEISCAAIAVTSGDFSDCEFYIYDSVEDADKAFENFKEKWFIKDGLEVTDNTLNGSEYGVCDASIQLFMYKSGNLVVRYEDWVHGIGEATREELEAYAEEWKKRLPEIKQKAKEMHERIMSTF